MRNNTPLYKNTCNHSLNMYAGKIYQQDRWCDLYILPPEYDNCPQYCCRRSDEPSDYSSGNIRFGPYGFIGEWADKDKIRSLEDHLRLIKAWWDFTNNEDNNEPNSKELL